MYANLSIDTFSPLSSSRRGRSPIIYGYHDVALLSKHHVPKRGASSPHIAHYLHCRLAVHIKQNRILSLWVERRRMNHACIKFNTAFFDRNSKEFRCGEMTFQQTIAKVIIVG